MLISAVSVLVVAQSSSEIPEGLMNNPVVLSMLNLDTRRGGLSLLHLTALPPVRRSDTHCTRDWVGLRAVLEMFL